MPETEYQNFPQPLMPKSLDVALNIIILIILVDNYFI